MSSRPPDRTLEAVFRNVTNRLHRLETSQRAEQAGGVQPVMFTDLPTPGQHGRTVFVKNGRKIGEGGGAGTGVIAYDDGVHWRRPSDDAIISA